MKLLAVPGVKLVTKFTAAVQQKFWVRNYSGCAFCMWRGMPQQCALLMLGMHG